jgi:hypothetical protein
MRLRKALDFFRCHIQRALAASPFMILIVCPETVISLDTSRERSPESGYFRFGRDAVCYWQADLGIPVQVEENAFTDLLLHVTFHGSALRLPS